MASEIDPALVERIVAWFRDYGNLTKNGLYGGRSFHAEALAIAEALPKPVDPDILWLRGEYVKTIGESYREEAMAGVYDGRVALSLGFAAIKRGRELEREGK